MGAQETNHRGASAFARLGRAVVRRPLVPIVAWLVLLAVTVPFLSHLGSVTTSSAETLPSNAPSALASAKLAHLFPNESGGSSAILLFVGPNLVGPVGQGLVLNTTAALQHDRALQDIASVESVYTAYASYLAGEARIAGGAIAAAEAGSPGLLAGVRATSGLLWGPPALYVHNWDSLAANASAPYSAVNLPAYNATAAALSGSSASLAVLSAFYGGYGGSSTGFNGSSADCAATYPPPSAVATCAQTSSRTNLAALAPHLAGVNVTVADAVLSGLGIANATNASDQRTIAAGLVAVASGLPASWVDTVWTAFGGTEPSAAAASAWAASVVTNTTLAREPLPVPLSIRSEFVSAAGTASLIDVSFSVADDATNASGGTPVDHDLGAITTAVDGVLVTSDPTGTIAYYLTGPAPLDALTNEAVASSLALVLPLTVGLLLGIAMLYFRSPVAPLASFAGLAVALVLGLGATVVLGTLVTHIDNTAIVLEEVFVLGVGTDYSIFLVARYREELVRGKGSEEAIVTAVTWAGQAIATSGTTAILVTLALALSGVALLSQWGMVLSAAILLTMLVALTLLPALLRLLGPRIFWPFHGARFARAAAAANARAARGSTYFYRAARLSERHPVWIVGVVGLVSVPLVAVALQVPVSYDFYGQLPSGHPATAGLDQLGQTFGPGFAVPSFALVTFAAPLVVGTSPNVAEFAELAQLTAEANATAGIASVRSPVGPYGASLASWDALASAPPAAQQELRATLGAYVGSDRETVLLQLQPSASGLSLGAVNAVSQVEGAFDRYASGHANVTAVAFGGGAPVIHDLAADTDYATEVMLIAVSVGLVLVLLAVLRSWIIAVLAVASIGLSISWAWSLSDLVLQQLLNVPLFFYVRTILIMLVLGLGIDYNIFLLTRVREERLKHGASTPATVEAVGRTGGIITAAAVILASAFAALTVGEFTLIRAIGLAVAVAVAMDAMVVRTYLVPGALHLLGERVWTLSGRRPRPPSG